MKTTIEDIQLDTELQELYIISKHWISDLEFFIREIGFLKRLLIDSFSQDGSDDMMRTIRKIEDRSIRVEKDITSYLCLLQPLINKTNQTYQLSIIETHVSLESEMEALLRSFKSAKQIIFQLRARDIEAAKLNGF